ncbi:hypothetical protein [Coleofasciculus sp. FACHB-501]|nr:hypothetical protein [Coleofasciculus sp. FACHB-501]MBD1839549.1 hypothetical protein [Coleofasciculus sp. FACHB-501]
MKFGVVLQTQIEIVKHHSGTYSSGVEYVCTMVRGKLLSNPKALTMARA